MKNLCVQICAGVLLAVTKNAAAGLVYFSGRHRGLRCANLRQALSYGWHPARFDPVAPQGGMSS